LAAGFAAARGADLAFFGAAFRAAFLAGFFEAFFLPALRFAGFFAVLPAAFFVVFVFFAPFFAFLAAIIVLTLLLGFGWLYGHLYRGVNWKLRASVDAAAHRKYRLLLLKIWRR
jgi:hypothetical protein